MIKALHPPYLLPMRDAQYKIWHAQQVRDEVLRKAVPQSFSHLSGHEQRSSQNAAQSYILPIEVALLIGDCIHDIRTSLDHVLTEIAFANGAKERRISMPICDTKEEFEKEMKKTTLKRLPSDVKRFLHQEFTPYKEGNFPIWSLHKLNNIDKHRAIMSIASVHQDGVEYGDHILISEPTIFDTDVPFHSYVKEVATETLWLIETLALQLYGVGFEQVWGEFINYTHRG